MFGGGDAGSVGMSPTPLLRGLALLTHTESYKDPWKNEP